MSKIIQTALDFEADIEEFLEKEAKGFTDYRILSKSLDARGAPRGRRPKYNYRVEVIFAGEKFTPFREEFKPLTPFAKKPIIIGAGPAGLFAALRFAEYGIPSVIFERGERAHARMKHIARFWRYGEFNPENNVCYGEGGAGLFSDGKLITRVKSPYVQYVMNKLVDFGAPEETAYLSNPHLGSNKIRQLISKISDYLISKGCEFHYNTRVDELLINENKISGVKAAGIDYESEHVILATGHSASEMYEHLKEKSVAMKAKDFAVGVRVEHPRRMIDFIQHGKFAASSVLGAARYRLSYEDPTSKKGTYSFCMCPGGYVLSSGTDANGIVVNGMSNYARNSPWSNAALVVSVKGGVDFTLDDVLNGLHFQKNIEHQAYKHSLENRSGKEIPSQTLFDFLDDKVSDALPKTSCPSGIYPANLREILPEFVAKHISNALSKFDEKMKGFVSKESLLLAPETRTSAPITISRDKISLESENVSGLYPCGEGAGYAGGITSAAVDGVKVVMAILGREG